MSQWFIQWQLKLSATASASIPVALHNPGLPRMQKHLTLVILPTTCYRIPKQKHLLQSFASLCEVDDYGQSFVFDWIYIQQTGGLL